MAQRIELITPGQIQNADAGTAPPLQTTQIPVVVTGTADKVGWLQKIKSSYKAIVAFIGALVILASQIQAITPFLPAQFRGWIGAGVAILTAISTFLVSNEKWVDNL
jgi:hypothetical protein